MIGAYESPAKFIENTSSKNKYSPVKNIINIDGIEFLRTNLKLLLCIGMLWVFITIVYQRILNEPLYI